MKTKKKAESNIGKLVLLPSLRTARITGYITDRVCLQYDPPTPGVETILDGLSLPPHLLKEV